MRNRLALKAAAFIAAVLMGISLLAACAEAPETAGAQEAPAVQQSEVSVSATDNDNVQNEEEAATEADAEQPEDYGSDEDEDARQQLAQLDGLLDSIRENVQIGTAGASLKTAKVAADLMEWAVNTPLSDKQIEACVTDYIAGLSEDEAAEFEMQLMSVDGTCQLLLEGGQEDLMSDAGIDETDIPFGSDSIEAIESIMKAAGLR